MQTQNKQQKLQKGTNFWFGFSLGITAATGALYFLGTKKGRESLQKILDFSENIPEHLPRLIQHLEHTGKHKTDIHEESKKEPSSFTGLIHKLHEVVQIKQDKKIFVKDHKK